MVNFNPSIGPSFAGKEGTGKFKRLIAGTALATAATVGVAGASSKPPEKVYSDSYSKCVEEALKNDNNKRKEKWGMTLSERVDDMAKNGDNSKVSKVCSEMATAKSGVKPPVQDKK